MTHLSTYIAFVIIAGSANCSYGLTSFGPAILFQFGWHLCEIFAVPDTGSITDAVTDIMVIGLFVGPVQFFYLRALVNWSLTWHLLVFQTIFTFVGIEALFALDSDGLKVALGVLFLFVGGWKLMAQYRRQRATQNQPQTPNGPPGEESPKVVKGQWDCTNPVNRASIIVAASCSGFLSGLFGTKGPPLMVFVTFSDINPNEWRATSACSSCIIAPFQVAYMLFYKGQFDANEIGNYCVMVPAALIGLYFGNMLADRVNRQFVNNVILWLLMLGSILLMTAGSDTATAIALGAVSALSLVALVTLILVWAVRKYQAWRARKEAAQSVEYESLLY